MSVSLKETVFQNANLQIVGRTPRSGAARNADMVGVETKEIPRLKRGEFFVRPDMSGEVMKFRTRTDLLGNKNSVGDRTWKRTVNRQVEEFYRPKILKERPKLEDTGDADIEGTEW